MPFIEPPIFTLRRHLTTLQVGFALGAVVTNSGTWLFASMICALWKHLLPEY